MALAALLAGALVGALHVSDERRVADEFGRAWEEGDYAAMYRLVAPEAKSGVTLGEFEAAYRATEATATATSLRVGEARDPEDDTVPLPVRFRTRIFGTVGGLVRLRFVTAGDEPRVDWRPELTFPGVAHGLRLERDTRLPPRRAILARDGQPLAQGPERSSPIPGVAAQVVGEMGAIPADRRQQLTALGYPADARVGTSGFERAFNDRLAGTPGGTLSIGSRVVARSEPRPGRVVRTTISPDLVRTTIGALGGRNGAVAVVDPATGEVLSLAGPAYTGESPPGSTFKLITTTAALEDGKVRLDEVFPVQTAAVLEGVELANAHGEACGGSFEHSFAESCNSVFAPLGVKVGPKRLVEVAEKYGFNRPLGVPGAARSTIPPADQIGDDLAVGATAIGQGKVLTSALEMATIAATIANRGLRAQPTVEFGRAPFLERVTSARIAATIRSLMVGVVKSGTGTAADIPGVAVAGKTGTAELGSGPGGENVEGDTDAWFVAFAPARAPKLAVGVVVFRGGAGGDAAAPVAREILASAVR
jgi:cell division protein FtsI/penicillin-binding protein 2